MDFQLTTSVHIICPADLMTSCRCCSSTICCMCSTFTHSGSKLKQHYFVISLLLTSFPACGQAVILPPSSTTSQLILALPYALSRSVSSLSYFFLLPVKPCSSMSYKAKSLLHQSLESEKGQFIFMNVYIKYNLPKHSLFLVRLTKQNT